MMQLIELFQQNNFEVHFATTAALTEHMDNLLQHNVQVKQIVLNHDSFDTYIKTLNPSIVLFDRFMTEEQFGWRVALHCPDAVRVLDTEDLHSLRKTRQEAFKKKIVHTQEYMQSADITKREIASVYRCDLSLIISTYEMELLQKVFKVHDDLLVYMPFFQNEINSNHIAAWSSFSERNNFMCIGNFRHEPNWNMVQFLQQTVWPQIRKKLPKAELHVYGAYPPQKATQLSKIQTGFVVKGWANNVHEVMQQYKVCLAPINFGAGIKGKFVDAMQNGLPSVTTSIGAEGMSHQMPWGGFIADEVSEIVIRAIMLYTDADVWQQAQIKGTKLFNAIYANKRYQNELVDKLVEVQSNLEQHRATNFIGAMLQHHTMKSSMYLSKWIAEKNTSK